MAVKATGVPGVTAWADGPRRIVVGAFSIVKLSGVARGASEVEAA